MTSTPAVTVQASIRVIIAGVDVTDLPLSEQVKRMQNAHYGRLITKVHPEKIR